MKTPLEDLLFFFPNGRNRVLSLHRGPTDDYNTNLENWIIKMISSMELIMKDINEKGWSPMDPHLHVFLNKLFKPENINPVYPFLFFLQKHNQLVASRRELEWMETLHFAQKRRLIHQNLTRLRELLNLFKKYKQENIGQQIQNIKSKPLFESGFTWHTELAPGQKRPQSIAPSRRKYTYSKQEWQEINKRLEELHSSKKVKRSSQQQMTTIQQLEHALRDQLYNRQQK